MDRFRILNVKKKKKKFLGQYSYFVIICITNFSSEKCYLVLILCHVDQLEIDAWGSRINIQDRVDKEKHCIVIDFWQFSLKDNSINDFRMGEEFVIVYYSASI